MPTYAVNEAGVSKARELIESHQYDLDTPWSKAEPSTAEENDDIERHGYEAYGEWHLAVDTEAREGTKERYGFPYGDFRRVNRAALIHAKQRASQNGHDEIAEQAGELLELLDSTAAKSR